MVQFSQDENDRFPPCETWCDALMSYVRNPALLGCSGAPNLKYAYAMNKALDGMFLALLDDPSRTPLLFDSAMRTRNASFGITGLCEPPRHLGRSNILFADGHVASVTPSALDELLWLPQQLSTR